MIERIQKFIALLTGNVVTVTVALSEKPVVVEGSDSKSAIAPGNAATIPATNDGQAKAKAKLVELLNNPQYKFRSLTRLAKAIGRERWQTEELLADIGARPSRRNPQLFGLTSRVGNRQYA